MEISLTLLEEYFEKTKYPISISVSVARPYEPTLVFIVGKSHEGSRRIYLDYSDLDEILKINNVYVLLKAESMENEKELREVVEGKRPMRDLDARSVRIEKLIYETLMKYIYQMMNASMAHKFFPEIVPLKKHADYFKEHVPAES